MKNTELIESLVKNKLTATQVYNLVVDDLFDAVTEDEARTPAGQKLIAYFEYKIQQTFVPVINKLKEK